MFCSLLIASSLGCVHSSSKQKKQKHSVVDSVYCSLIKNKVKKTVIIFFPTNYLVKFTENSFKESHTHKQIYILIEQDCKASIVCKNSQLRANAL